MTHTPTWLAFAVQLAHALRVLEDDDAVIIGLSAEDDAAPYVQFVVYDESMARGEVSSNAFLPLRHQLTEAQIGGLVSIGWQPPTSHADDGSPNFFIDRPTADADAIASMTVETLVAVFNIHDPSELDLSGADLAAEDDTDGSDTVSLGGDGRYLDVTTASDGSLCFRGQTLTGDTEYEYALTVSATDVPKVISSLDGEPGSDATALVAANFARIGALGVRSWLVSIGVEAGFWNHFSFDSE
ncbi:MAG: hypothetical protein M3Y35_11445 [Actinomycetota bacterium]|nr:hypothetical protein [Actinomycetota bacterium]